MSLIHIYGMITSQLDSFRTGINYMINVIRCGVFLYYTNNLFPYYLKFVNYFRATQNQHLLFWLLKDAQLTCKRCPLRPLLTPFWNPIKHLLLCHFITNWFPYGYKHASYMCFCRYLLVFYLKLCNDFSNIYLQHFEILKCKDFQWKRMKIG